MANQLSKFTPQLAEMTKSLRDLLSKKNQWNWQHLKKKHSEALTRSPVLSLYNFNHETTISADASSYGLGAILRQKQPNGDLVDKYMLEVIAYISRSLTPTEQRYAQIEKEGLAVTWGCERSADYLVGLKFHIKTDHKPLVSLFVPKSLKQLP